MIRWTGLLTSILLLAGCGDGDNQRSTAAVEPTGLEVVAVDFGFSLEVASIPAGEVQTTLINEGKAPHQLGYYRLNDGIDYEEFVSAIMKDDSFIPRLAEGGRAGVMRSVSPGDSYTRPSDDLSPGSYALLCSIRDPETGKNHYELGMVAELLVR